MLVAGTELLALMTIEEDKPLLVVAVMVAVPALFALTNAVLPVPLTDTTDDALVDHVTVEVALEGVSDATR